MFCMFLEKSDMLVLNWFYPIFYKENEGENWGNEGLTVGEWGIKKKALLEGGFVAKVWWGGGVRAE